jgi:GNAT superfamily N-acetyltransferase
MSNSQDSNIVRREADMNTDAIDLRPAGASDALCIGVLGMQVFLETYAPDGIRPDLAREVLQMLSPEATAAALARSDQRFIVAERAGHLLGFVHWRPGAAHEGVDANRPAELFRLYVLLRFAGGGLGTRLLRAAEEAAVAEGADTMWLTAWAGNARARAFYPRRGYADVGTTAYVIEGIAYENRLFARSLGAG